MQLTRNINIDDRGEGTPLIVALTDLPPELLAEPTLHRAE